MAGQEYKGLDAGLAARTRLVGYWRTSVMM